MEIGMISKVLVGITCVVYFITSSKPELINKFIFYPRLIDQTKQYYRFITHGFLHANQMHLFVNMIVLFSFGSALEHYFARQVGASQGVIYFLLLYFSALIVSSIPSYLKHRDDPSYRALGASGATAAVLFSCILFNPWANLLLFFVIPVPQIIFGVLYIGYEYYQSQKANDNIGHDAHLSGAIYGVVFTLVSMPEVAGIFAQKLLGN